MDYSQLDDQALIGLISRRNADALGEFYDRYTRLVFSLAMNTVGDAGAAEEITLDVFARVWEKAGTYRAERAQVTTWLTSIARYRSIDELRRRSSRPEQASVSWAELVPDEVPRTDGPAHVAELEIQRAKVRAAVAELPHEQRQALALAYFQGYSHREIAEALGQPLGTVKTRIRLAMQKLREKLHDEVLT